LPVLSPFFALLFSCAPPRQPQKQPSPPLHLRFRFRILKRANRSYRPIRPFYMKTYSLHRRQLIRRPLQEVFRFFSRPENLAEITPASLGFQMLTPQPIVMKDGAVIDYLITLFGLPLRWRTLITEFSPPHRFVDLQLRGPYAYWHHTHSFVETDDGTIVADEVRYALPFGLLGRAAHTIVIRRQLNHVFDFRARILEQYFSSSSKTSTTIAAKE
jgi:ligand-binding SRPBCC domain-containing protein